MDSDKTEIFIETKRLYLRQWKPEDKKVFYELNCDPEVMRYFPSVLTLEQSNELADKIIALIEKNKWGLFAAELKLSGEFIGFIGLHVPTFEAAFMPCIEIGWRLHKHFWKKGYATEGALAVLDFGFNSLNLSEIISFTSKQNGPSMAVMERIGMKRDYSGDFDHPKIEEGHPLRSAVLYRINKQGFTGFNNK